MFHRTGRATIDGSSQSPVLEVLFFPEIRKNQVAAEKRERRTEERQQKLSGTTVQTEEQPRKRNRLMSGGAGDSSPTSDPGAAEEQERRFNEDPTTYNRRTFMKYLAGAKKSIDLTFFQLEDEVGGDSLYSYEDP